MDVHPKAMNSVIAVHGSSILLLLVFLFLSQNSFTQQATAHPVPTPIFLICATCNSIYPAEGTKPEANALVEAASYDPIGDISSAGQTDLPPGNSNPQSLPQAQIPPAQSKENQTYSPTATSGSPGHIFWVIPAFKVNYQGHFQPLNSKEKFQEWFQGAYDPLGLTVGVVEAGTLEYSSADGFCGYGHGWDGYGKCFGSMELDANVSSFIGDYALAVLLHQDPRYFRMGHGSFGRRAWYSISRVFITYNDAGHNVFYSSALAGTVIASGVSNLYYPQQDRGLAHSASRAAIDLGNTALYNVAAEFWPDIHRGLHAIF